MTKKVQNIKFHEDIAIADVAFTVKGKTKEELFENAAIALISSMADISKIKHKQKRNVCIKNKKLDILLFDFLNELIFYKDTENLLFSKFNVKIKKSGAKRAKVPVSTPLSGGGRGSLDSSDGILRSPIGAKEGNTYKLAAVIEGEKVDPERHRVTTDIKAITMHMFKVEKTKGGYEARVVVDV